MSFDHQSFNADYVNNAQADNPPINDAANYGVRIVEAEVAGDELYWKIIGIHHLLPEENRGNLHLYLEMLDEDGQRVKEPYGWVGWTWEGRQPHEIANPVHLDKPPNEPAGNIGMHFGQKVTAWVNGLARDANDKSDLIENVHTAHGDEFAPTGEKWNYRGHHSFYVVFQRTRKADVFADGVISGTIENGEGYKVRLIQQGNTIREQLVDNNFNFRFTKLRYGTYRLEAVAPGIEEDNIRLQEGHEEVTINLTAT